MKISPGFVLRNLYYIALKTTKQTRMLKFWVITGSIIAIGYKFIQTSISILAIQPCLFSETWSYVLEININTSSPLHFSRGTYISSQVSSSRAHGQRHLPAGLVLAPRLSKSPLPLGETYLVSSVTTNSRQGHPSMIPDRCPSGDL